MNHSKFIKDARPLIEFIEEQGGPKMYEWFDLDGYIHDTDTYTERYAECPPAVTAAICMWIMDACEWCRMTHHFHGGYVNPAGLPSLGPEWRWNMNLLQGIETTKELAFLALLDAICKAIGYEGEIK